MTTTKPSSIQAEVTNAKVTLSNLTSTIEGGNQRLAARLDAWCQMLTTLGFAYAIENSAPEIAPQVRLNSTAQADLQTADSDCTLAHLKNQNLTFISQETGLYVWEPKTKEAPSESTARLTKRELDVLKWGKAGKTVGETAIILKLSPKTVAKHRQNIYHKTGQRSLFNVD